MKKRLLSVFLTVAMLLTSVVFVIPTVSAGGDDTNEPPTPVAATGLWTDFAATAFEGDIVYGTEGHGTEENPYKIATPEQLAYLAKLANEYTVDGKNGTGKDFATDYFVLTQDINLAGHNWMPISATYTKTAGAKLDGTNTVKLQLVFMGSFDGQGHTIRGITFGDEMLKSNKVPVTIAAFGLFGSFGGTMKNLKVEGTAVFTNLSAFGATNFLTNGAVAILAGAAHVGAVIENVEANVLVDVTSSKAEVLVGGMVGYASDNATFKNCVTYGSVKSTGTNGVAVAGGMIAATVDGTDIYDSVNYAEVKAVTTKSATIVIAGGVVGKIQASANADTNNFEMGIGTCLTGLSGCTNYGKVSVEGPTCKARVGGFIGQAGRASSGSGKGDYILLGCVNHGEVITNYYNSDEKSVGVSALVGLQEAQVANISKCLSSTYAVCTDAATAANMPKALVKHLNNKTINGTLYAAVGALVPAGNIFVTPESGVITVADGASLRLNPTKKELASLRFDCKMSEEALAALANTPHIVGVILVTSSVFEKALEGSANTAEAVEKLTSDQYRHIKVNLAEDSDGSFSAIYANIYEEDFATDIIAIPYLSILLNAETGSFYTVYDEYTVADTARTVNVKKIATKYYDTRSDDATDPFYFSGTQLELLEYYMSK